jgi:hypothetical protein
LHNLSLQRGLSYDPATCEAHTTVAHDRLPGDRRRASDYRDRDLDCSPLAGAARRRQQFFCDVLPRDFFSCRGRDTSEHSARLERLAGRRVSPSPDSFRQIKAMEDFGPSPNPDGWGRFSTYSCIAAPIVAIWRGNGPDGPRPRPDWRIGSRPRPTGEERRGRAQAIRTCVRPDCPKNNISTLGGAAAPRSRAGNFFLINVFTVDSGFSGGIRRRGFLPLFPLWRPRGVAPAQPPLGAFQR